MNRREFLQGSLALTAGLTATSALSADDKKPLYRISLAEWSLHRAIRDKKELNHLDFAKTAKEDYGIDAVEYVNQMFATKAKDKKYLGEMKKRASDAGVKSLLIMIDREGNLGDPNAKERKKAIEKHYKWVEAAKFLGCHSIRVNARSSGKLSYEEQMKLAADGLSRLTEFAAKANINVIVENHGGLSSNGKWLAGVMKKVNKKTCGTLPDFGNFNITRKKAYDKYKGVKELMPFAKAVSAKSYDFNKKGDETTIDYLKMMKIVVEAGYRGHVGIEYEGRRMSEPDGIKATKKLLDRVHGMLSSS